MIDEIIWAIITICAVGITLMIGAIIRGLFDE